MNKEEFKKKIFNEDPLIFTISNFLSKKDCNFFIKAAHGKLQSALVGVEGKRHVIRTGKSCFLKQNYDKKVTNIISKIASILECENISLPKSLSIINYKSLQGYAYHTDAFDLDKTGKVVDQKGKIMIQRKYTAICYLNDVKKGGFTRFALLNIDIKPALGKLLIFKNVLNNSNLCDKRTLHGGLPVIEGEKWLLTTWF